MLLFGDLRDMSVNLVTVPTPCVVYQMSHLRVVQLIPLPSRGFFHVHDIRHVVTLRAHTAAYSRVVATTRVWVVGPLRPGANSELVPKPVRELTTSPSGVAVAHRCRLRVVIVPWLISGSLLRPVLPQGQNALLDRRMPEPAEVEQTRRPPPLRATVAIVAVGAERGRQGILI
jgi:hypothetical protein